MNIQTARPSTLAEVARRAAAEEQQFDPALREFLDEFYTHASTRQASIDERPEPMADLEDNYIAATAEYLATSYGLVQQPFAAACCS